MTHYAEYYHVVVLGAHSPEQAATTASLVWPQQGSAETYTVQVGENLSFEFDSAFPVRLVSIMARDIGLEESVTTISRLTAPELAAQFAQAAKVGQFVIDMHISLESRLLLADLQVGAEDTPESLREICQEFIRSHESPTAQQTGEAA